MRTWLFHALLISSALAAGAPVQSTGKARVEELLTVQNTVQTTLTKVRPAVVAIETDDGTASGVIISEDGLILTAAHVAEGPGRTLRVILESGAEVKATTLGLDKTTDAALMRMNDAKKKWPFVKVSRQVELAQPGEWCFALGHPGGFDKDRGVVLRVGKIIKQAANSLQTDCVLMGGDSGGPLFNLAGELIGVHSQIWEGRDENMHVSMAPFLRSWEAMKGSHVIHVWATGSGGYLGVATEDRTPGHLEVVDVIMGSPAAKAGLRTGDVIVALNGEAISDQPQFSNAVRIKAAGDVVKLRIRSGEAEREVPVTLGTKPNDEG
ncbi:MAG: trypsin-like peptidase domain-containing protein [Prosthecobacter sp.]|nr:trypsin-like peptidase domain-containing protein [Prosthecobacter sp.]